MRTTNTLALVAIGLLSGCSIRYETKVEASKANAGLIAFDVPVPKAPSSLSVYELKPNTIGERVRSMILDCQKRERDRDGDQSAKHKGPGAYVKGESARCFGDSKTGDVELYPDLQELVDGPRQKSLERKRLPDLETFLRKEADLVDSETRPVMATARILKHARVLRNPTSSATSTAPAPMMVYASARRYVGDYVVDGPGSRAAMLVGADGSQQGFTRSWKLTSPAQNVSPPTEAEVRAQIVRQLLAMRPKARIHVQQIEIAYYDSNQKVMQPVYRFVAELGREVGAIGAPDHVVGYVPFAATDDPVPQLDQEHFPQQAPQPATVAGTPDSATAPSVMVGRFIARNDSRGWIADADAFWRALESNATGVRFVDTHVLPARIEQFTTESSKFVDSVDIALLEAHGAPWQFATEGNCCEKVMIGDESAPFSYGPGGGGKLKHWILHSCDVVSSPAETPYWADRWWGVFKNGLHTVVGYRTSMYISDGAGAAMGRRVARGEPVLSAWFSAVATLNTYGVNPFARFLCHGSAPMGRPSAISACGAAMARAGESAQVIPDCLDAWWIEDELARL